jgi:prepilin-type N-terminal cleavage/methylation domain-containing protein
MRPHHRRGVTLIELLVVMAIITVLATLIVAVAPRFGERQRASRGAGQLQSWLNLAKQRAMRDQRPVGIRLPHQDLNSTPTPNYIRELQYVELPGENVGGTVRVPFPPANPNTPPDYRYIALTVPVKFDPNDQNLQNNPAALIQREDVVSFPDRPLATYSLRRITPTNANPPVGMDDSVVYVGPDTSTNPPQHVYKLRLDQPLPQAAFVTQNHVFLRKARPVVGEPVLQLPKDIAIDITQDDPINPTWNRLYPAANSGGLAPFDILFAPSGQVVGGSRMSRICLWVRDVSLGDPAPTVLPPGENTLITIYTRTGHVTSHPVDPAGLVPTTNPSNPTWNPFKFTQDGLSSSQ